MNTKLISLVKTSSFSINLIVNDMDVNPYSWAQIFLMLSDSQYEIYSDDLIEALHNMHNLLQKVLNHELPLHESINHDFGFLLHQLAMQDKKFPLSQTQGEYGSYWLGLDYLMLSSNCYDAWIYNKQESIVLEITPWYSGLVDKPTLAGYKKFIKNTYKPIAIIPLDKQIVLDWLHIVRKLLMPFQQVNN